MYAPRHYCKSVLSILNCTNGFCEKNTFVAILCRISFWLQSRLDWNPAFPYACGRSLAKGILTQRVVGLLPVRILSYCWEQSF